MVLRAYGGPDSFERAEVPTPTPAAGEVLVRMRGTSVHPGDAGTRAGYMRGWVKLTLPAILGVDVAGEVVAVGPGVTQWKVGDPVIGYLDIRTPRAYAEFVAVKETMLARAPKAMPLADAGVIPGSGATAWQAMTVRAPIEKGMRVLVNGASGGTGTFAVQIATALGAHVTGVCSGKNADLVRRIGADHVIDYTQEALLQVKARFDVILDTVRGGPGPRLRRLLAPGGILVLLAANPVTALGARLSGALTGTKVRSMVVGTDGGRLAGLVRLIDAGKVTPVIEHRYDWKQLAEAHRRVETNRVVGKLALHITS